MLTVPLPPKFWISQTIIIYNHDEKKKNQIYFVSYFSKLYEYQSVLDNSVELHYPTKEVSCAAKLSCISWNTYLRNYLASSDYDGFVTIWDMAVAQKLRTFQVKMTFVLNSYVD